MDVSPLTPGLSTPRCFVEDDPTLPIFRRSIAEALGTAMLLIAVVGSGAQSDVLGADQAHATLTSAIAIAFSLIALILAFGSVSGGHFNPTITIMQWMSGQRHLNCTISYVGAQLAGAVIGAMVSSAIFSVPIGTPSLAVPDTASVASEALASFGLMMVVFGCARGTNKYVGPFAVGLWLLAAILSTPTGSLANPAVTLGLLATPRSEPLPAVLAFMAAQIVGGGLALRLMSYVYPGRDAN